MLSFPDTSLCGHPISKDQLFNDALHWIVSLDRCGFLHQLVPDDGP